MPILLAPFLRVEWLFGADVSVQRVSYDSAGPVFFNQARGLLAYMFPTSQLVFGSVSLLNIVTLMIFHS